MIPVHLRKVDVEKNMARFYHVDVALNLFNESAVLRSWGRIGTGGRMMMETCATAEEAEVVASKTIRTKLRRGYRGRVSPEECLLWVCG